ncbi:MAG: endonuclease domain-containing protein [Candidatus Binataceae bacterium]
MNGGVQVVVDPATAHDRARRLRASSTDVERKLWFHLRARQMGGCKFRRQHPIGPFYADFCCVERRLILELDGGQHDANKERDERRTAYLKKHGYRVIRFWNGDVMKNLDGVLEGIAGALNADPHLTSP